MKGLLTGHCELLSPKLLKGFHLNGNSNKFETQASHSGRVQSDNNPTVCVDGRELTSTVVGLSSEEYQKYSAHASSQDD